MKITTRILISIFIALFYVTELNASHVLGADITYQYIGSNQYGVQVRLYRDCIGIAFPSTIEICYQSDSCFLSGTSTLTIFGSPFQLPQNPLLPVVTSSCNGGTGFGVERYLYMGIITLPASCSDWKLSLTSMQVTGGVDFVVSTFIDNINYPQNNSISFLNDPTFIFCGGVYAIEYFVTSDTDGDSVAYEIVPTLVDNFTCPTQPTIPNSATMPWFSFPDSFIPPFIHATQGWLQFIPSMIQVRHISARISEYRNGIRINQTSITHQALIIFNCILSGVEDFLQADESVFDFIDQGVFVETADASVYVVSATGQIISQYQTGHFGKAHFDLSALKPGLYVLNIVSKQATHAEKFVIH